MTETAWARRYDAHAELHLPYDVAGREALKATVPAAARVWSKACKCWHVQEPFVAPALRVAGEHFGPVAVADLRLPVPTARERVDWAQATYDALPERLRRPAYRALLRVLHPDKGGDVRLTQRLNDVFDRRAS